MRIKRTDRGFAVKQKEERQIHYAGQEKKHTGNKLAVSPSEKQEALQGRRIFGRKTGTVPKKAENLIRNSGKTVQQEQSSQRPSSYHETSLKTREFTIRRKEEKTIPIQERENKINAKEIKTGNQNRFGEKSIPNEISSPLEKAIPGKQAAGQDKSREMGKISSKRNAEATLSGKGSVGEMPENTTARTFAEKREAQISAYRERKYREKLKKIPGKDKGHIHKREAKDSFRQRKDRFPKKKQRDQYGNRKEEKPSSRHKDRQKRAATFRLLAYASDKFSQEEQKDSLLKVAKDLAIGKIKAAVTSVFLSAVSSLLPILLPVFIITMLITLLFNSPFSILLPKLSEEPGSVEILTEYTAEFREMVQEELSDLRDADEAELIYEDYEGDGEPDNMADILMVYMVRYGFGDIATLMTEKNRRALKDTFDEMTFLRITYRKEMIEESYEEEDIYGNIIIKTKEVEIRVKEVRITLLTSEDIIRTGIFTAEEIEILRYLMSPEVLENIEGITGGYGKPGAGGLTPEEESHLGLGSDTGSQAVKNALKRLGVPYSQAYRDSGDYYDCSSLTYYAYKEAGITLSYHGANTAAAQAQLLSERGCEVDYEDIQPGDLIFYSFTRNGRYRDISHVAIYAGNGYLVDASSSKGCVVYRPVYSVGSIVMCGRPSWL